MTGPTADPYTALAYARAVEAKATAQRERLEAALHAIVPQSRTHTSPWMRRDGGLAALLDRRPELWPAVTPELRTIVAGRVWGA